MSTYRKNGGGRDDLPLTDGTSLAVLGPVPRGRHAREHVGPMFRVIAVDGVYGGRHFVLFADEIEGLNREYLEDES